MKGALLKLEPRPRFVEEVYSVLLDAISSGRLAPGTRLTQEQLAAELNVSRSPVLQALRLLKKDGLVQDAPGRGLLVTSLDPDRIAKVYQVRGALDVLAVKLAAEARFAIDPALLAKGRRACRGTDVKALIDADLAFHKAIYEASGNEFITQSALLHWVHLRRVMGAVLQAAEHRERIWDEHEAIAAAIAEGDSDKATSLAHAHTARARDNVIAKMNEGLHRTTDGVSEAV